MEDKKIPTRVEIEKIIDDLDVEGLLDDVIKILRSEGIAICAKENRLSSV